MREWTDLDYAQAAIDMLPGSVEEIEEWMKLHEVKGVANSHTRCPVAKWTERWTGKQMSIGVEDMRVRYEEAKLPLPEPVTLYIMAVDRGIISP